MSEEGLSHDLTGGDYPEVARDPSGTVYTRLEAARLAIYQVASMTPEGRAQELRRRAVALSRPPQSVAGTDHGLEVIEFLLGEEHYAVESTYVAEVYSLTELTPLPCTPPFVLGIINVRGRILSVIDLKQFFGIPARGITELNKVILASGPGMDLGVLADAIIGVRCVLPAELQTSLPTLIGLRGRYLKGVTDDRLVVLDLKSLLSDPEIIVQEEVEA